MTNIEKKKSSKIIFGSKLSKANNDNSDTKKINKKSRKKNLKIIFGSEFSETNNESTFG